MGKICWNFPPLLTGNVRGVNDAGITMFKSSGEMDSLAREVCQNSLDARDLDLPDTYPVKVKFELFYLKRNQYDMFDEFEQDVQNAKDFWKNKNEDVLNFLNIVSEYLSMEEIPVLIMSDYNTTGLKGDNSDSGGLSYWDLLVNTEGISIKQDRNSGGSFGIGKNAPFAYSGLRMVFYNTLGKDGFRAFEGVTRFVTTLRKFNGKRKSTQDTGKYLFIDDEDEYDTGRPIHPEDECLLAKIDEFNRNVPGTDVAIFGFKTKEYESWEEDISIAVLKNFILAVKDEKLEVEVTSPSKHYVISKNNIEKLLYDKFGKSEALKQTRQIYETITGEKPIFEKIAEEDDLSIYVRYNDEYSAGLSRFRSTGMLINTTAARIPPHYSVVVIANSVGKMILSTTLRKSEPPQHNEWKAKNITDDKELFNRAQKYIQCINKAVKKAIEELENSDKTDQMDAGIGKYLPDASGDPFDEGSDGSPSSVKVNKIFSYDGKIYYNGQYESASSSEGNIESESGIITGERKYKKHHKDIIHVVTPDDENDNDNDNGVSSGAGMVRINSLSLSNHRIFYTGNNKYHMIVNSTKKYDKVFIRFNAARDDRKNEVIPIKNMWINGMPLSEIRGEKSKPVQINEGVNSFDIEFESDERMAIIPIFMMEVLPDEKQND